MHKLRRFGFNAIKESFDRLPTAVCFFDRSGGIVLCNRQMYRLSQYLLNSDMQYLEELQKALASPPKGIMPIASTENTYRFPDGLVWKFEKAAVTDRYGETYIQLTAADVTALHRALEQAVDVLASPRFADLLAYHLEGGLPFPEARQKAAAELRGGVAPLFESPNNTLGIAVGMACNICSFNLAELCATTVALMKDPHHDIAATMPAPDFVGGGQILYDEAQMREIYEHGRGSVKVRARYNVVPGENMIEITQIPPTTTVEAIMDKIAELVKAGKIKEISDMRDETDLNGLKLTLDLKRGVDADKLMAKLFKTTPLEDSFSANFNILVAGQPRVMGVREILQEWTAFRVECVRRRTYYDLHGKEKRLHLLQGLAAILLDIDKAIKIIRTTEEESEVVPNLMIGFGIDEVQADYVAEIKLRHLNREYILKRTSEIEQLEKDIADLNDVLAKPARVRRIIINELNEVAKKYAQPRRSEILYDLPEEEAAAEEETVPDYPVTVFFTHEGYLKKIPPQSLRTAGAHKLKEGDEIVQQVETRNNVEALFFTDKQQVYKVRLAELEDGKVAQMGIFVPGRLGMDEGENILAMVITGDYSGFVLFFFASGKCAKIPLSSYATKQNRRKLLKAYCDKEPLAKLLYLPEETELAIRTSASRMLLVGTAQIAAKATRDSQGVAVVTLKKNQTIASVVPADTLELANPHRYRVRSLPATGALIRAEDEGEQMSLL